MRKKLFYFTIFILFMNFLTMFIGGYVHDEIGGYIIEGSYQEVMRLIFLSNIPIYILSIVTIIVMIINYIKLSNENQKE